MAARSLWKGWTCLMLAVLCGLGTPASFAENSSPVVQPVTGLEWLQMSIGQRLDSVMASMVLLDQNGVRLNQSVNEYYNKIEEKLKGSPDLYGIEITDVLASIVYDQEPDTRPALDRLRKTPSQERGQSERGA